MRRRQPATNHEISPAVDPVKAAIRQREVQLSDWEAVASLKSRWGLTADSLENWERFWRSNPAVRASSSPLSMGWVLETEDRIVGYLGSIPLLYRFGDRRLIATVATGFVMEPAFRGLGFRLMAAFYQQKNVDLFLNTTAIESVGRLTRAFRAEPLPQQNYETVLFWVFNARAFAKAVVSKFGVSGGIGCTAKILGSAMVKTETIVSRRGPRRMKEGLRVTEESLSDLGEEFEALWQKQLVGESRLLADRSPASLKWHFTIPGDRSETKILCCRVGSELKGYAILRIVQDSGTGLIRCNLADLVAEKDDYRVAKSLLCAAFGVARKSGSHVFEVLGFPNEIRRILMRWKPYCRKYPACPFFFKARDPKLQALLAAEGAWYATPFDGDTTLMP